VIPRLEHWKRLAIIVAALAFPPMLTAQTGGTTNEKEMLEAVRQGRIQVNDEMINAQKALHPELRKYSNQEIRRRLEEKANGKGVNNEASGAETEKAWGNRNGTDSALDTVQSKRMPGRMGKAAKPGQEEKSAESDSGTGRFPAQLKRFGYDFFSNNPSNSGMNGGATPALPDYILSPGDEIQIYTWGRENQNQTAPIDNEGMFHYPPLAPMRLAGMKFSDAQDLLTREIQKINGMKASVGLGRLKSIRVFVLGEVVSPGAYVVPAGATVTSALFQSGGIQDIGSLRAIQLKRNGKAVANLDLYEMLLNGNNRTDQQLLPGDVIFVPVAPIQVAVTGMVKRTGIYEVKPGTKVLDVLGLAGGLSSNAFKGRIRLDRVESHRRKVVLDVPMEKVGGGGNAIVQDGDMLNVEEVLDREYDVVYLRGNVNRPGRYEFKKGMTIKDLIPSARDLKTETFFSYGHIKRSTEEDQRALLLPFSLKDVFDGKGEVPLMPRDTVIVYSRFDIMDEPEVKISGTVRKPGRYPFVNEMKVSDLVIAGGGLTEDAYLPEAHLIRALKAGESDSLFSKLIKVNLANLIENPGDSNNVELRASDSLIIFPRQNFILPKFVTVNGSVKTAGKFQLTQDMGLPELISQAEGLTRTTYTLNVEVVRKTVLNDSLVDRKIYQLNLKDIIAGKSSFRLQDGDAVYIRDVVDRQGRIVASLQGELNFPGKYEVAKNERLSSVIRRAGGFSEAAYLRGVVFIRKAVKDRQLRAIDEISRKLSSETENMLAQTTNEKDRATIQAAISQRKTLLEDAKTAPYLGRVVIHLDRALSFAGTDEDIIMEDEDSLFIPSKPSTISILGEVFSPTNVVVGDRNSTVGKCLNQAGGVSEYGDAGNIYYIQPDGSIVTPKNTSFFTWRKVEPGGSIIVPPKGPKKDYLDAMSKITQIIYQIAISVGVAKTVF
jgi:polysaccharide export outer membrane protein